MEPPLPRLLRDDTPEVNLDYAASAPALEAVWEAVAAFAPRSSSVHRGAGPNSRAATEAFEAARGDVARFVGARRPDDVVFVRNTTEAINVLAAALPQGTRVLSSPVEHHANMLPWRRHDLRMLPFTRSPAGVLDAAERALRAERIDLVAVTGASNVTGEVWPLAELATLAHRYGAKLFVDAAQLAPHRPIDMVRTGIDMLAFSGHKLYAPFGAGALVGRIGAGEPLLHGGGAIRLVTLDDVVWADAPDRYEAGSPNVIGVVALAAACRALLACRHGRGGRARAPARRPPVVGPDHRPRPAPAAALARHRGSRRRGDVQRRRLPRRRAGRTCSASATRSPSATAVSARTR